MGLWQTEVKLYSRALSAEEVAENYAAVTVPEIPYEEIGLQNILTDDVQKPQYHGGPYQFWMNEPHAPLYYNGVYHLFFQQNMQGSYWRNIAWGHLVSDDMVHWREMEQAVAPPMTRWCPTACGAAAPPWMPTGSRSCFSPPAMTASGMWRA